MEESIRNLIINTLHIEESKPNKRLIEPSFILDYKYMSNPSEFEDGKCVSRNVYVQIDLYYLDKSDCSNASDLLVKEIEKEYSSPDITNIFDNNTKLNKSTLQFIITEREVNYE